MSKVPNGEGATAVRVLWKQGRRQVGMEHMGTGRTVEEIALLVAAARRRITAGQDVLPGIAEDRFVGGGEVVAPGARVLGTVSAVLWEALEGVWAELGFEAAVPDKAFKALTLARVIEPTSKLDSARVLAEVGAWAPANTTIYQCLKRCQERGYRDKLAAACWERAGMNASLLLYDVTTLYFETDRADGFRESGFSKERRLEPQVVVGLLVDQHGFPLGVHAFEGNVAETKTVLTVVEEFAALHKELGRFTVVADAGMLSEHNLVELTKAGFDFIVGSRIDKVPWAVTEYTQQADAKPLEDQQVFIQPELKGSKKTGLYRYVTVYQYRAARAARDLRAITDQVAKAEATIAGTRKTKKARFVTTSGTRLALDEALIESAKARAGIKGYITSLPVTGCPGRPVTDGVEPIDPLTVINAYHQLFEVERSFRMSKTDLRARPVFSHVRPSIEAHLTMVMAALAVSRTIQARTGLSIRRWVRTLRPLRAARVRIGGQVLTIPPEIDTETQAILDATRPATV